jgi:hypothetical protein
VTGDRFSTTGTVVGVAEESEALRIRRENLTWREVGGEIIALDLVTSTYFTTNTTGSHLWNALVEGAKFGDLVALLEDKFGISEDIATDDVRSFIEGVDQHGLLETPDDGPA